MHVMVGSLFLVKMSILVSISAQNTDKSSILGGSVLIS